MFGSSSVSQPLFSIFQLYTAGRLHCGVFFLFFVFFVVFFCVPQLYLWGSPLLGEIFAYVTVF